MEDFYHCISKAINIDKDRQEYTELYNFVRKSVIDGLKENFIFNELFADLSLCGSYADNLKVSKPDEFDLVVRLEFPFHNLVELIEDTVLPGNVYINLADVIDSVGNQNLLHNPMLAFLNGITNDRGLLLQDKFQSWFEGILTKYLNQIKFKLIYEKNQINMRYKKQGPAHTIRIRSKKCEISIDFVPGFRFAKWQSLSPKSHLIEDNDKWEAIPKPVIGKRMNPSFQCSYTESERRLLSGRNQFKNTIRMMKKFRDTNPALVNLKSYFIKTLFLWYNETTEQSYWNNSNETIMDVMFENLEKALEKGEILFFWDENVNLLKLKASPYQINCMYYHVRNARKVMSNRSNPEYLQNIKNLFLTQEEQSNITPQLEEEIQSSFLSAQSVEIVKDVVTSVSPWVLGLAAGAFIWFSATSRNNQ